MKYFMAGLIMLASVQAVADLTPEQYPSCDLQAQRNAKGETGGNIVDAREAHISVRVNVLQADISTARKARRLTQEQADRLWQQAGQVRSDATHFVKLQGFLSAAERASYDRELDEQAGQLCHRVQ
ncbi:hypothetical protein [Pantoea agglomerans]|uniref:hypothetical protein n=1 Tax=Enterobacter agglomerans TaxID=549 RepID=UPI003DA04F7B